MIYHVKRYLLKFELMLPVNLSLKSFCFYWYKVLQEKLYFLFYISQVYFSSYFSYKVFFLIFFITFYSNFGNICTYLKIPQLKKFQSDNLHLVTCLLNPYLLLGQVLLIFIKLQNFTQLSYLFGYLRYFELKFAICDDNFNILYRFL